MSTDPGPLPPLPTAAIAALNRGNKIEAIKITRQERGIELKEAKDAVDHYISTQPTLQASFAARQVDATKSLLFWVGLVVAVAVIAYFVFRR